MRGKRIPRKFIHGVPIEDEEDTKPFPGFMRAKVQPEWQDIPDFRLKEVCEMRKKVVRD